MEFVYDDNGNRIGFRLSSPEEIADFERLTQLARRLKDEKYAKARKVFDAVERGNESVDFDDRSGATDAIVWSWADELDDAIRDNLDHRTIGAFIQIVLESRQKSAQVARALARHTENRNMKADVFAWLDANMSKFESMDEAAGEIAGKLVPIKWRTARDWITAWKKERAAGTP